MRTSIGLLMTLTLFATTAVAQPATTAQTAPATSPAPASTSPAPIPAAGSRTLDGLTVVAPLPQKPCSSRDKTCIAMVVAELKQRYPEQLKRFCFQRTMRSMRTQMVQDQLLDGLGGSSPPTPNSFGVNSALSTACAWDKK